MQGLILFIFKNVFNAYILVSKYESPSRGRSKSQNSYTELRDPNACWSSVSVQYFFYCYQNTYEPDLNETNVAVNVIRF
jgi:hypothetical protein